ncbi:hypothetical protein VTJ49DRAFT_2693 [Mycothermus thermophilus]|uniref:Uncharacterized protein n=1 Tax=Humicola insolens TaxID=85995 RepID=A0ABR3V998_HUMIN
MTEEERKQFYDNIWNLVAVSSEVAELEAAQAIVGLQFEVVQARRNALDKELET